MAEIVIVEDEEVIGRIYKKKLEAAGHQTHLAFSIQEAETLLETITPDILLLDHGIRGQELSGLDLLRSIRHQMPDLIIIMLSNYNEGTLKKQALDAGADDFYVKINTPPKVLIHQIEKLLR